MIWTLLENFMCIGLSNFHNFVMEMHYYFYCPYEKNEAQEGYEIFQVAVTHLTLLCLGLNQWLHLNL